MRYLAKMIIVLLLYVIHLTQAYADFSDSCPNTNLPVNADYDSLKKNNAYGYVLSQIDTTKYVPASQGCNVQNNIITICFATPGTIGLTPPCQLISFKDGDTKKLYDSATIPSQPATHILKNAVFTANLYNQSLCIFMQTVQGNLPLVCKAIASPTTPIKDGPSIEKHCRVSSSCYDSTANYSQSLLNFSGKAFHCVKDTLDKILTPEEMCLNLQDQVFTNINPFAYFQNSLKNALKAALMAYIVFFGIRVVLNPYELTTGEIVIVVFKVILVMYFSVGIGNIFYFAGGNRVNDGITQIVLPFLLQALSDFPTMIFDATNMLDYCRFSVNEYPSGYSFYKLWDTVDCRTLYYMIGQVLTGIGGSTKSAITGDGNIFGSSHSFMIIPLMFRMLLGGQIILLLFTIVYVVVYLSLMLYFISSYLACLICLYVMAYIAPIFIPMILFERTKSYYDAWLRIFISFALQPMVIAGFMAILLTFYDQAVFGGCNFNLEMVDGTKQYQINNSGDPICQASIGYKYYDIIRNNKNIKNFSALIFTITIYQEAIAYGYLIANTIFLALLSFVFYFFSKMVSQFAADITGGIQVGSIAVMPTKAIDGAIKAAQKTGQIIRGTIKKEEKNSGSAIAVKSSESGSKDSVLAVKSSESGAGGGKGAVIGVIGNAVGNQVGEANK